MLIELEIFAKRSKKTFNIKLFLKCFQRYIRIYTHGIIFNPQFQPHDNVMVFSELRHFYLGIVRKVIIGM